jgi:hypothetical protein
VRARRRGGRRGAARGGEVVAAAAEDGVDARWRDDRAAELASRAEE